MYQLFCLLGSRTQVSCVRVNNLVGMLYHLCCERNDICNPIVGNTHILKHDVFYFKILRDKTNHTYKKDYFLLLYVFI